MKSELFKLGKSDWVKAFWMFLLSTIVGVVGDAIMQAVTEQNYSFSAIHWKDIGAAIAVSVIAYLKKDFITNSDGKVLTKDPGK